MILQELPLDLAKKITIHCDGCTPSNGVGGIFGDGYGSYKIHKDVHRVEFNRPMSCNEAEVETCIEALKYLSLIHISEPTRPY